MDVALVLTHRCNFACGYCYAGEHHKTDMDEGVLERAVELLFADAEPSVQLSFFGGEPFLAFDAMRRAVTLAEARAKAPRNRHMRRAGRMSPTAANQISARRVVETIPAADMRTRERTSRGRMTARRSATTPPIE